MSDEKKEAVLLDHDYDGIQEYDNPLPNWWLVTFFATILFSGIYFIHYEISGIATSLNQEFEAEMKLLSQKKSVGGGDLESEEALAVLFEQDEIKKLGMEVFQSKCASCHRADGGGLIGPNLADSAWLYGKGHRQDILKSVKSGIPEKGMPPWESMISHQELIAVSAHVHTLAGTNPPNPKEAQGQ